MSVYIAHRLKGNNNLLECRLRMVHSANPDFEAMYPRVVTWWLELSEGDRRVRREIGLDAAGEPLVFAPFRRNPGVWLVDGWPYGSADDSDRIAPDAFERAWNGLAEQFAWVAEPLEYPRVPVGTPDVLIGGWYLNAGWGSMGGDVLVVFFPDGRGFHQQCELPQDLYSTFEWRLVAPGQLSIRGTVTYSFEGIPRTQADSWRNDWGADAAPVATQRRVTNSGEKFELLHLGPISMPALHFPGTLLRSPKRVHQIRWPIPD